MIEGMKRSRNPTERRNKAYVPENWDELSPKERDQIHRGRRGQRALQKMIRHALRGRAEQHCQALNAFHSPEGQLARSKRRWPDFPAKKEQAFRLAFGADLATRPPSQRTIGRLILTRALEDVRSIFDQMIKEHEPHVGVLPCRSRPSLLHHRGKRVAQPLDRE